MPGTIPLGILYRKLLVCFFCIRNRIKVVNCLLTNQAISQTEGQLCVLPAKRTEVTSEAAG